MIYIYIYILYYIIYIYYIILIINICIYMYYIYILYTIYIIHNNYIYYIYYIIYIILYILYIYNSLLYMYLFIFLPTAIVLRYIWWDVDVGPLTAISGIHTLQRCSLKGNQPSWPMCPSNCSSLISFTVLDEIRCWVYIFTYLYIYNTIIEYIYIYICIIHTYK